MMCILFHIMYFILKVKKNKQKTGGAECNAGQFDPCSIYGMFYQALHAVELKGYYVELQSRYETVHL